MDSAFSIEANQCYAAPSNVKEETQEEMRRVDDLSYTESYQCCAVFSNLMKRYSEKHIYGMKLPILAVAILLTVVIAAVLVSILVVFSKVLRNSTGSDEVLKLATQLERLNQSFTRMFQNDFLDVDINSSVESIRDDRVQQLLHLINRSTVILKKAISYESEHANNGTQLFRELNYSLFSAVLHFKHESQTLQNATRDIIKAFVGSYPSTPASSCAAILQANLLSPSDYYWVQSSNGSSIRIYCDMTRTCGNITGGWMRVAKLDMTKNFSQCPPGLCLNSTSPRTCRLCTHLGNCSLDVYPVGVQFSRVCGRVIGYQIGTPDGFSLQHSSGFDGVNLTYGTPSKSLWTFIAATGEDYLEPGLVCPCINVHDSSIPSVPSFIGSDYFCDTGSVRRPGFTTFFSDDPLWDGAGCGANSTCCSFNNPPWFYKELPGPTTEDI